MASIVKVCVPTQPDTAFSSEQNDRQDRCFLCLEFRVQSSISNERLIASDQLKSLRAPYCWEVENTLLPPFGQILAGSWDSWWLQVFWNAWDISIHQTLSNTEERNVVDFLPCPSALPNQNCSNLLVEIWNHPVNPVERYTFQIMGLLLDALTLKHHRLPLCRMILTSSKASPSVKPLYTELFGRPNPRKEGGEQATKTHPLCVFNRISTQIIDLGPNWTQLW